MANNFLLIGCLEAALFALGSLIIGGYSHARRTEWAKKLVGEGPKKNLAESRFFFKKAIAIQLKLIE